ATRGKTADRTVGHLPSQSFRNRSLPVRHSPLLPVKATKLRPLDFDLAAVEPDLALRFPPAARAGPRPRPWRGPEIACASYPSSPQAPAGRKPGRMPQGSPKSGLKLDRSRRKRTRCSKLVDGVAFLWSRNPHLSARASNAAPPISTTAGV